jgi:AcrR family transcriptional regulator
VDGAPDVSSEAPARRSYDSTLRRQRAAETRERILAAAGELLAGSSIRDWRALTMKAVAERAGVNERTVYRHFHNEQGLRDAVMHQFEHEAGVDLEGLTLDQVGEVAAHVFTFVSAYPPHPRPALDPTLGETRRRQQEALLRVVSEHTASWPDRDRTLAAALVDLLWSLSSYEHLRVDWRLDHEDASRGLRWVIDLVTAAVRDDRRPD